jgi:hypothetical protein
MVPVAETANPVSELIADVGLLLDELLGRRPAASPVDFVRRNEPPSDIVTASSGFAAGGGPSVSSTPELEAVTVWGRQIQDWVAQQDWLAQELATINYRAQFYLQGLTPPPAPTHRISIQWSKVDPARWTQRFVSNLWAGCRDAAWGLSKGVSELAGFPGLFNEPVRQAHDSTVRTRTSLRTPWRIDL